MRWLSLAFLPVLFTATLRAQPFAAMWAHANPNRINRGNADRGEIQSVIAMARAAPPEFAADALITIVESGLIADPRAQRDLLEEAFALAANAQEKIAFKRGAGDSPITSALHGAFRNGIDQASLRSRASTALLRTDRQAAREMFERIDLTFDLPIEPRPGGSVCQQQVVPDLTLYYVAMWEVARSIPERDHREGFLREHLARFRSTAQITPLARVLMQVPDLERMPALADAFSLRLPDLDRDPRVFSTYHEQAIEAIGQLVSSIAPPSRERMIQASRAWAIRNIDEGVCAESPRYEVSFDGNGRRPVLAPAPETVFNRQVARQSRLGGAEILASDLAPREPGPFAPMLPNSSDYAGHFRTHLLLARDDDTALDVPRWRGEMQNYIASIAAWSAPEADRSTFYLEKSDLLAQVLFIEKRAPAAPGGRVMITPTGARRLTGPVVEIPGRDRVMNALVAWFDGDTAREVYASRRLLWFSPVRDLLGTYEDSNRTLAMADLYARSQNPVLGLYGRLAKLVATPQ